MTEIVKTFKTLTEDEFYAQFNCVKNHFYEKPEDCSFDGCMFETYGKEVEYINEVAEDPIKKHKLWTIIEAEGNMYYVSGFHYVNRFGYIITEEAVPENIEYDVELDTEVDHEPSGPFDQLGYEQTEEE